MPPGVVVDRGRMRNVGPGSWLNGRHHGVTMVSPLVLNDTWRHLHHENKDSGTERYQIVLKQKTVTSTWLVLEFLAGARLGLLGL
jgi:hypothetical protein